MVVVAMVVVVAGVVVVVVLVVVGGGGGRVIGGGCGGTVTRLALHVHSSPGRYPKPALSNRPILTLLLLNW